MINYISVIINYIRVMINYICVIFIDINAMINIISNDQ